LIKSIILTLNSRAEGVTADGTRVPRALPGEEIALGKENKFKIILPSKDRITPVCAHYKGCGGCSMQHSTQSFIKDWKSNVIKSCLSARGLETIIKPILTSKTNSRRRVTLHGMKTKKSVTVGFFKRNTHELISTPSCELVNPEILSAFSLFEEITLIGATRKSIIEISVTVSKEGLDLNILNGKKLDNQSIMKITGLCESFNIARITWNEDLLANFLNPTIVFQGIAITPPPNAFLQATEQGQEILITNAMLSVFDSDKVIDLFSGCGTFTLPAAKRSEVLAIDKTKSMLTAIDQAWRETTGLKKVTSRSQDLFKEPVGKEELNSFDAAIIDPPRVGAEAQSHELAKSHIKRISSVSCNPRTFSRDAKILVDSGFKLDWVQPIDQFLWSSHIELVAQFSR
jgi:23S rRNA (uracil1939-C5)-methyltransferase|tara:strand:+ start:885 stop:2087 length:1203 start_codon:yes stop_codon:yes gene_type:complete